MRVLYIRRNFWNSHLSWLQNKKAIQKRYYKFKDQDGFLRGSLHNRFTVDEKDLATLYKGSSAFKNYAYLVVNYKADSRGTGELLEREFQLPGGAGRIPAILYIGNDLACVMPDDSLLDRFDLVLKRQPYRDLDRYDISTRNKDKIWPTTLACPLVPANKKNIRSIRPADFGFSEPNPDCTADVCFSGQCDNPIRTRAWSQVVNSQLTRLGGLQKDDTHNVAPPPALASPKLKKPEYSKAMRNARVNLALDGLEEFSYRHVETWCLACFALCSPTARELTLPFPAQENKHYVCFDDLDDLIDKIRYYAGANDERMRIAAAGRRLFETYFSFEYHGRQLHHWFETVAQSSGKETSPAATA